MEEITLKDVLDVVLDLKQEMKEMKQEMKQEMQEMRQDMNQMNVRIEKLEKGQKEIIREQVDTRDIVRIIVDKIGQIDKKLDEQAKDKCMFHKTLVGAKSN